MNLNLTTKGLTGDGPESRSLPVDKLEEFGTGASSSFFIADLAEFVEYCLRFVCGLLRVHFFK